MNTQDNQIFLKFIERQLDKKYELYSDETGFYFWGEESHKIIITSNGNYINFIIENPNKPNNRLPEVSIPVDECKSLLDYMYGAYLKTEQNLSNYRDNKDFIQSALKEVKDYLKSYEVNESEELSFNTVLYIPNRFQDHILRVGRMFSGQNKKSKVSMLGFTNIPLTLYKDAEHNYEQIKLIIPYWEIEQYPCLKHFISVPEKINSLNEVLASFKENESSLYSIFFHHIVDHKVENKKTEVTNKNKL